jgi:hypothetical protein
MPIPQGMSLEDSETRLEGKNKESFLDLMRECVNGDLKTGRLPSSCLNILG